MPQSRRCSAKSCTLGVELTSGADVFSSISKAFFTALVVFILNLPTSGPAAAEDLVMPYSCAVNGKNLNVTPANDTAYRIVGRRFEQPFVACRNCETMMVHRFTIECDGAQMPWSRITQAATQAGVKLPSGLPAGFAPLSALSGRFVLPALVRTATHSAAVSMQDLSPDSVTEVADDWPSQTARNSEWVTEVRSDVMRSTPGSNAGHVAASLGGVLLMLFAASMVAAGRWRMPASATSSWPPSSSAAGVAVGRLIKRAQQTLSQLRTSVENFSQFGAAPTTSDETANALLILQARLIEVEFAVASLAPHLLLRDVLSTETAAIRARADDIQRQASHRSAQKTAAILRNLLRELDRIGRIARSAYQAATDGSETVDVDEQASPQTMADAYRILGINPDAAPVVAKKLVDALRMSWHPDHARDEGDRRIRESRMKQINAAWDLVKSQRAAA